MSECTHEYAIRKTDTLKFCLMCKQLITIEPTIPKELVMPPRIYEITEKLWKDLSPWRLLGFDLALKNDWYISMLFSTEYLIMPIKGMNGDVIYYSARRLTGTATSKYLYPEGVRKSYYVSNQTLESPIIITEGVADAVYASQVGTSIALLGAHYDGSLNDRLVGKHVAICMDGDPIGLLSAMRISTQLKACASVKVVVLPAKKDPTDLPVEDLAKLIRR